MARWRLIEAHYLYGYPPDLADEGVEWEYKETDRTTGRERRKRFKVPFYSEAGDIVCIEGRGLPTDTIFEGDPTPNMEPLDEEARQISARFHGKWAHPIETLPGQGFSASMLDNLTKQLDRLAGSMPTPVVQSGVSRDEFEELKQQLAMLMAENAALKTGGGQAPAPVYDVEEPLGPVTGEVVDPQAATLAKAPAPDAAVPSTITRRKVSGMPPMVMRR